MKIIKDLVPKDGTKLFRYAVVDDAGNETGEYLNLKYAPGELAQTPTPVNADLFEDLYGYANETITVTDDAVICTSNGVTATTKVLPNGDVQTVKTDGVKTVTVTIEVHEDGTIEKVVS